MGVTVSDETVKKVKDSWDIVLQIPNCTQVAGELLFRNIFKTAPGAHKMFPFGKDFDNVEDRMFKTRMFKKHAKLVVGMLDNAVQFLGPDLNELEDILIDLGAKHVTYGILPEHYPIVGQALLETLAAALGPTNFNDDLKQSWVGVYGFITTSMLKGANESLLKVSVPVYTSGKCSSKKSITLDEYVSSMLPGQTELYYITMSTDGGFRGMDSLHHAKELQKAGVVILHIHKNKQGLLAKNLQKYLGRKMVDLASTTDTVDPAFLKHIKKLAARQKKGGGRPPSSISVYKSEGLNQEDANDFCVWFQSVVGSQHVKICTPTCTFASQAARVIQVIGDGSGNNGSDGGGGETIRHLEDFSSRHVDKKHVEINPNHPLIIEINKAREVHPFIAKMLAAQIYDNCLTQAGMLQDYRIMVNRINDLSIMLLQEKYNKQQSQSATTEEEANEEEEGCKPEKPDSSTEEEGSVVSGGSSGVVTTRSVVTGISGGAGNITMDGDSIDGTGSLDSAAFNEAESYGLALLDDSDDSDSDEDRY